MDKGLVPSEGTSLTAYNDAHVAYILKVENVMLILVKVAK